MKRPSFRERGYSAQWDKYRAAYLAAWQQLERGQEFDLEYRIVHTDGGVRWVKNRALPCAEDGTACGLMTDITERKRADEEQAQLHLTLQCVSAEWRLMFDAASAPMLMLDAEGRVLRMNQTAQRLAGWSYEQALGQRLTDLSVSSLWVVTAWLAAHAIKRRRMQSCEVHEEPSNRWWEITAIQFADTVIGARVIVVLRDSTAHKRAEAALRKAERHAQVEHEKLLDRLGDLAQRFGTVRDLSEIYQALSRSNPMIQPIGRQLVLSSILRTQSWSVPRILGVVLNSATGVLAVLSSSNNGGSERLLAVLRPVQKRRFHGNC